jgi:hypothetical protein
MIDLMRDDAERGLMGAGPNLAEVDWSRDELAITYRMTIGPDGSPTLVGRGPDVAVRPRRED